MPERVAHLEDARAEKSCCIAVALDRIVWPRAQVAMAHGAMLHCKIFLVLVLAGSLVLRADAQYGGAYGGGYEYGYNEEYYEELPWYEGDYEYAYGDYENWEDATQDFLEITEPDCSKLPNGKMQLNGTLLQQEHLTPPWVKQSLVLGVLCIQEPLQGSHKLFLAHGRDASMRHPCERNGRVSGQAPGRPRRGVCAR